MLPANLQSIYQQYKADTDLVANWLATNAKTHGYHESTAASSSAQATTPKAGGRLKGKARKEAKAAAADKLPNNPQGGDNSNNKSGKPKHVLAIRDFEPMANYIAQKASGKIEVPSYFAVALERVVWVRKTFSQRLASRGGGNVDLASDGRHQHFASVLEKVRDTLKPLMTESTSAFNMDDLKRAVPPGKEGGESSREDDLLHNMFGILEAYEPSEAFLNAPDVTPPPKTQIPEFVAEPQNSIEDVVFALAALLSDYERLRNQVMGLWSLYDSGDARHIDLAAASVATNTAFELARAMENDLDPILNNLKGGYGPVLTLYFQALCQIQGIDALKMEKAGDSYNLQAYPIAQSCLLNTLMVLNGYRATNSQEQVISNYNGAFGWYDESLGDSAPSNRGRKNQDHSALMEMLPDIMFLTSSMGPGLVQDEMMRGMDGMIRDKVTKEGGAPLWLAWACQIYLDILQHMGARCDQGFKDMQWESRHYKTLMAKIPESSPEKDEVLFLVSRWDKDHIKKCRDKMTRMGELPKREREPTEFQFLRRNPMHCGLWVHRMRSEFHYQGVHYASKPGAVMCVTQLYHALRQEKLLRVMADEDEENPDKWEDLDIFWEMQGNATFFVGDGQLPSNPDGYFNNYCLSIGSSITNFAPSRHQGGGNKNKNKVKVNPANRRNMKFKGYVSQRTAERLIPTLPPSSPPSTTSQSKSKSKSSKKQTPVSSSIPVRAPLTAESIQQILTEAHRQRYLDGKGNLRTDIKQPIPTPPPSSPNSPIDLVLKIASTVRAEWPELDFSYFAMHRSCRCLLERLRDEMVRIFGGAEGKMKIPPDLTFLVGYIFSVAAGGRVDMASGGKKGKGDQETGRKALEMATGVVRKFLEEGKGEDVIDYWMGGLDECGLGLDDDDDYDDDDDDEFEGEEGGGWRDGYGDEEDGDGEEWGMEGMLRMLEKETGQDLRGRMEGPEGECKQQ